MTAPLPVHHRECIDRNVDGRLRTNDDPCICAEISAQRAKPAPMPFTFGQGHDGPPCIWDNAPTRRAGACWVCPMCGESTSC